ncbi:MAG: hypothetical protein ACFBSD_09030 [Paracoccaceae bacterium]
MTVASHGKRGVTVMALSVAVLIGACAAPAPTELAVGPVERAGGAERAATGRDPGTRRVKYLVDAGWTQFRVNVRYVRVIGQMVIAIRQDDGTSDAAWERFAFNPPGPAEGLPVTAPFEGADYEQVAVALAKEVARRADVCGDAQLTLDPDDDGGPRRMYRGSHEAWVIFGSCAAA